MNGFPAFENGYPFPAARLERFESEAFPRKDDPLFHRRFDTKYVFPAGCLREILPALPADYVLLLYEGHGIQKYESVYLDDDRWTFYRDHQRGKLSRSKARLRLYRSTGYACLELKTKTNKQTTLKRRRPIPPAQAEFADLTDGDRRFLRDGLPAPVGRLSPVLRVSFSRLTLKGRDALERVTLDTGLGFEDAATGRRAALDGLIIAEVKQVRPNGESPFRRLLRNLRILPGQFSKYCCGVFFFHPELKHNLLKECYSLYEKRSLRPAAPAGPAPGAEPVRRPSCDAN